MAAVSTRGGWWRRNWWALLALLPVLAAMVLVSPEQPHQVWRSAQPREPVAATADGWVRYAGARLRLRHVHPADLRDPVTGREVSLPAGVRAWQVTVEVEWLVEPYQALPGCQWWLVDQYGRRYGADAYEVRGAQLGVDGPTYWASECLPEERDTVGDVGLLHAVFLLPAEARPEVIQVTLRDRLPRYVRFDVAESTRA